MPPLPETPFFLFGAGPRRKLLYLNGALTDALTGELVEMWDIATHQIIPAKYTVRIFEKDEREWRIHEDAEGVWICDDRGRRQTVATGHVNLPTFQGHPFAEFLRVLHFEILTALVDGRPLPNPLAYHRPQYRHAAMICMVLARTNNLPLVWDWIDSLRDPFDRNNGSLCEPDNLGQVLYMISLATGASHPLVETILARAEKMAHDGYLTGPTDFTEHPVYQTKWLKFGLRSLGLDDPFRIPEVADSYSSLFWMAYRDRHVDTGRLNGLIRQNQPQLGWAEAHFHGDPPPMDLCSRVYPLTWEAGATRADHEGLAVISHDYVRDQLCAPHGGHAAEMFLYLIEQGS